MAQGLVSIPLLPLRSEPSERSELISQLLFGETFEVLEVKDAWSFIRNMSDGYEGWATTKMLSLPPETMWQRLRKCRIAVTEAPLATCITHECEERFYLPAGSRLFMTGNTPASILFPQMEDGLWVFKECTILHYENVFPQTGEELPLCTRIVRSALLFEQAPYLWGGKSILGMDCSGLVQLAASIHGVSLPRDAKDQVACGSEVEVKEAREGDLAFFANPEGRIVHVGILLNGHRILHASGTVHIDSLDSEGIFNKNLGCYTHRLASLRRIFVP